MQTTNFRNQVTMKTVVTKIKPNKEGKVTNIRRNGALEAHSSEAQDGYSLSSTATGDPALLQKCWFMTLRTMTLAKKCHI